MKKALLLTGLLSLVMLVGCNPNQPTSSADSSTGTSDSVSSSSTSEVEDSLDFPEDVSLPDGQEEITRGECGGAIIDMSIGAHLVVGKTYTFTFSPSVSYPMEGDILNFSFSNEGIFEVNHVSGDSYSIVAKKAGGAIMTGADEGGFEFIRMAVNARNEVPVEDAIEYMCLADRWESQLYQTTYDNYVLYFKPDLTGVFLATESGGMYDPIDLTLTYENKVEYADSNEYIFAVEASLNGGASPINVNRIAISTVCDIIHVSEAQGVIDFFRPVFE